MATEGAVSGSPPTTESESAAQKLLAKHKEAHPVEVEDVVDEEDLAHPPPSANLHSSAGGMTGGSATSGASMSDTAKGKQKADDSAQPKQPRGPAFDVQSDEAFPALGGPAPRGPSTASQTWGKKPAAIHTNGSKPSVNGGSNATSRASTPGMPTPASTNPSLRNGNQQFVSIPGRHREHISLHPNQITPRNQLKKPIQEILRDINKRSKAKVETRAGPDGAIIFEGQGPVEAVRQALKEIVTQIGNKVGIFLKISSTRF